MTTASPRFTVVLPCFDEGENLRPLLDEIRGALHKRGEAFEVIFVDDASRDETPRILEDIARDGEDVRALRHQQNLGQSAAIASGFRAARGELVLTLDADGQNDPADFGRLLDAIEEDADADAACGVRAERHDTWSKKLASRLGNRIRDVLTGVPVRDAGCGLRVLRREILEEIPVFNGIHRFLPTVLRLQGYRVLEIEVGHRARRHGQSKYGIGNRAWRGLVDCLAMRWYRRRVIPGRR